MPLVPKPLRKSAPSTVSKKLRSKDWNPATFFIWIFLLIGSMSIQMIALRNGFAAFERRADAKIGLLKEVIERIQNGEKVDVSGLLGKGNQKQEEEWEQVLRDIEREEEAWAQTNKRKRKIARAEAKLDKPVDEPDTESKEVPQLKSKSSAPRGFY
ncbi:cell division protein [Rutstroemia sp. NJR-2017a BVV2]|nr:cell division protein [Rutstroemia sp. NJR-2017a BVV2]